MEEINYEKEVNRFVEKTVNLIKSALELQDINRNKQAITNLKNKLKENVLKSITLTKNPEKSFLLLYNTHFRVVAEDIEKLGNQKINKFLEQNKDHITKNPFAEYCQNCFDYNDCLINLNVNTTNRDAYLILMKCTQCDSGIFKIFQDYSGENTKVGGKSA